MSSVARWGEVLRSAGFRRLYACRLVAQGGDGIFQVALVTYVFFSPERQATAAGAAGVLSLLLLPYSVVGPFAGVLLDRWRRQRILVVSNLLRTVLTLGVLGLVATGTAGPPFYALVLALLSVNRFFLAAQSAALPHVVPERLLLTANSVAPTSGTAAAFAGAGVGLAVQAWTASDVVVVALAATAYLASAAVATRMAGGSLGPDHGIRPTGVRQVLAELADGVRHIARRPPAARALTVISASRFCFGIWTILTLLLYRHTFTGYGGLTAVVATSGCGFVAAALVTPAAARRWGERTWVVALLLGAAVAQLAGLLFTPAAWAASGLALGFAAQGTKICVDTVVQRTVDDDHRGRVFSLYDILFNLAFVAAAVFTAATVPESGRSSALVAGVSAGYAAAAIWYLRSGTGADGLTLSPPAPAPPAASPR